MGDGCLPRFLAFLTLCALTLSATSVLACSWDYPIWQIRDKKADALYRFIQNGKAGYINQSGKIIVKPTLDFYGNSGDVFHDGLLLTGAGDGHYVDVTGRVALDTRLDRNWDFSDGLAAAMRKGESLWGYIDKSGKFVIEPRFETYPNGYVYSFSDGLAIIQVKTRFGFIDRTGKFVIAPTLLYGSGFQEGKARVVVEGPCMRWDPEQPCDSGETLGEKDTAAQSVAACKFVFIDKSGRWISEEKFENAKDFSEGFAAVQQNGKWGFIDSSGVVVVDPNYDKAGSFSDGLARVKQGELWGFIDSKGKVVIPIQFEDAEHFADGLAPVGRFNEQSKEWEDYYFIDKSGKRAFEGTFEKASHFFKGLAHVKLKDPNKNEDEHYLNGKYAYINTKGKKVFVYVRNSDDQD